MVLNESKCSNFSPVRIKCALISIVAASFWIALITAITIIVINEPEDPTDTFILEDVNVINKIDHVNEKNLPPILYLLSKINSSWLHETFVKNDYPSKPHENDLLKLNIYKLLAPKLSTTQNELEHNSSNVKKFRRKRGICTCALSDSNYCAGNNKTSKFSFISAIIETIFLDLPNEYRLKCVGTNINEYLVLTSGECFLKNRKNLAQYRVKFGTTEWSSEIPSSYTIKKILYPDIEMDANNTKVPVLILLNDEIIPSRTVSFAEILNKNISHFENITLSTYFWKSISKKDDKLTQNRLFLTKCSHCNGSNHYCAEIITTTCPNRYSISGYPLFFNKKLIGIQISSFCRMQKQQGIREICFIGISNYFKWIQTTKYYFGSDEVDLEASETTDTYLDNLLMEKKNSKGPFFKKVINQKNIVDYENVQLAMGEFENPKISDKIDSEFVKEIATTKEEKLIKEKVFVRQNRYQNHYYSYVSQPTENFMEKKIDHKHVGKNNSYNTQTTSQNLITESSMNISSMEMPMFDKVMQAFYELDRPTEELKINERFWWITPKARNIAYKMRNLIGVNSTLIFGSKFEDVVGARFLNSEATTLSVNEGILWRPLVNVQEYIETRHIQESTVALKKYSEPVQTSSQINILSTEKYDFKQKPLYEKNLQSNLKQKLDLSENEQKTTDFRKTVYFFHKIFRSDSGFNTAEIIDYTTLPILPTTVLAEKKLKIGSQNQISTAKTYTGTHSKKIIGNRQRKFLDQILLQEPFQLFKEEDLLAIESNDDPVFLEIEQKRNSAQLQRRKFLFRALLETLVSSFDRLYNNTQKYRNKK